MKKEIIGYRDNPNIKNIHFDSLSDLNGNIGNFVNETKREIGLFNTENSVLENGVYIFQDFNDRMVAYRIYKDYADYRFTNYRDDILISKLQERQGRIKLSKFPFGIVTIEDKIIGQVIPYYEQCETMLDAVKTKKYLLQQYTKLFIDMIKIQEEMLSNGIVSCDCHAKNFVIHNSELKPIDFEEQYIYFDDYTESIYDGMISNLVNNIVTLSNMVKIPIDTRTYSKIKTLDDLESETKELHEVVRKLRK